MRRATMIGWAMAAMGVVSYPGEASAEEVKGTITGLLQIKGGAFEIYVANKRIQSCGSKLADMPVIMHLFETKKSGIFNVSGPQSGYCLENAHAKP